MYSWPLLRDSARGLAWALALAIALGACRTGPSGSDGSDHQERPDVAAATDRALSALESGNLADAVSRIEEAVALDPHAPRALFTQAGVYIQLERYEEARRAMEHLVERYPRYEGAWMRLGNIALKQRQWAEAVEHFEKSLSVRPTASSWYNLALAQQELNDADAARASLRKALELNRGHANAYAALADLEEREGNFEAALTYARDAVKRRPDDVRLQEKLGFMLLRTGRNDEAVRVLQEAVERQPWDYQARYNFGQALQRLGRHEEAEAQLRRAESDREGQAVLRRLERAIRTDPSNARMQFAAGIEYQKWGRTEEALRAYRVAQQLMPGNLLVDVNMATVYLHQDELDEARRRLEAVLARDESIAAAWLNLGFIQAREGQAVEARESWERALSLEPSYQTAIAAFQSRFSETG